MTKPLPLGAERQRPAKSCARCRASKAKCTGFTDAELAVLDQDLDAFQGVKRCTRCERQDAECRFMPSRRTGRPRRLPKAGEDEQMDGKCSPSSSSPDQQSQLPSPAETASPPARRTQPVSPPSCRARDTTCDALAQAYLTNIHPYAPLLPPTLESASAFLGTAGPHLHLALRGLLDPLSTSVNQLTPLSDLTLLLEDVLAGVMSVLLAYGLGAKEKAKDRLSWCARALLELGWDGEGSSGQGRLDQLGWAAWKMEVQLAVLTGVRERVLGHVSAGPLTASADSLQRHALALLFEATSTSPSDVTEAHHRAQNLISQSSAIYSRAHQLYLETRDEAAFMSGLIASAATIFLLSSSSVFSTFAAPAFACGIDSTSNPSPSARRLTASAAQQIMNLVRAASDSAAPRSPFFGCGLLVAVRGLLLSDELEGAGTEKDVQLVESVLEREAAKWEESRLLLAEVSMLRRTLLL